MRLIRLHFLVLLCVFVTGVSVAQEPATPQAPAQQMVTKVPTPKTLVLQNGDTVRLAAIGAPNLAWDADEEADIGAVESHAELVALAEGKSVRVEPIMDEPDRRGRIVAKVWDASDRLLQAEMLKSGAAWVYTFPDTRELANEFYAYEAEARTAKRGVWAHQEYQPINHLQAPEHLGTFRLVEGVVTGATYMRGTYYVNFGDDWKTDFTLLIEPKNAKKFKPEWVEQMLPGKRVRVRGWLFNRNGAMMEFTHPEQLELLDRVAEIVEEAPADEEAAMEE